MRSVSPPQKVVTCAMFENPLYVREFLKLGVSAYLVKSAPVEQLIAAVRVVTLDTQGEHVVVGIPREISRQRRMGPRAVSALASWRSSCSRRAVSATAR